MVTDTKVRLERREHLIELILCDPGRSNAIDLPAAEQLSAAASKILAADDVRAVLVRAEGKNFCVGGDIKAFGVHGENLGGYVKAVADAAHAGLAALNRVPVPVVAAVQGAVAGAGVGLALVADLVFLATSAKIRLAYTAIGLSPDNGGSWLLPRAIGPRRALELALTNRTLTADEAVAYGFANEVVDDANLIEHARAVAVGLTEISSAALVETKRLFRRSALAEGLPEHLDTEADTITALASTAEAQAAIRKSVNR